MAGYDGLLPLSLGSKADLRLSRNPVTVVPMATGPILGSLHPRFRPILRSCSNLSPNLDLGKATSRNQQNIRVWEISLVGSTRTILVWEIEPYRITGLNGDDIPRYLKMPSKLVRHLAIVPDRDNKSVSFYLLWFKIRLLPKGSKVEDRTVELKA